MSSHEWREIDYAHLLQKIILLQLLNEIPEKPCENKLVDLRSQDGMSSKRSLTLQREKELAEAFAFLAATTDDPKKIVAACVEEDEVKGCITVKLAVNNGGLDNVKAGFEKMSEILKWATQRETNRASEEQHALLSEAVALNQNRILLRLRSRHATSRANFKKERKRRPKLVPRLCEAINRPNFDGRAEVPSTVFLALKDDVLRLGTLFESLENLSTPKARSRPGLEILVEIIATCQHVHNHRILEQILTRASRLEPDSRAAIVRTITKLSRYSAVSQSLLQAARRNPLFNRLRISIVHFGAPKVAATDVDQKTKDFIHALVDNSGTRKLASKYHDQSVFEIEDYIRREATMPVPVHAEIQLLFHYEWSPCSLPPRIICSSKQACFLCNLFLRIHGRFIVPSTHGRMYEKWTLPPGISNNRNANKNVLTTCREFVSTIEKAILVELQSSRKPFPAPHESMILNSVASSQSNPSNIRTHDSFASQQPGLCEGSLSTSSKHTPLPRCSHMVPTEKATIATATAAESNIDAPNSQSETSSALTVCASPLPTAASQSIDRHEVKTKANTSHVLLTKGQPIWCEISGTDPSFEVRTSRAHLTITRDELVQDELGPNWDHYWAIVEYLPDHSVQDGEKIPSVDLLSMPTGRNVILDYDSNEETRKLRVYSKDDVISVTLSLHKPLDGIEHRS